MPGAMRQRARGQGVFHVWRNRQEEPKTQIQSSSLHVVATTLWVAWKLWGSESCGCKTKGRFVWSLVRSVADEICWDMWHGRGCQVFLKFAKIFQLWEQHRCKWSPWMPNWAVKKWIVVSRLHLNLCGFVMLVPVAWSHEVGFDHREHSVEGRPWPVLICALIECHYATVCGVEFLNQKSYEQCEHSERLCCPF